MKKNIIVLIMLVIFPLRVLAEGGITVSSKSLTIEQGDTDKIIITASNVIGDVMITSDNTDVATANISEWSTGMVEDQQDVTGEIVITGNDVGIAKIKIKYSDVVTFDEEDLSNQELIININVVDSDNNGNNNSEEIVEKERNVEIRLMDINNNIISNATINIYDENNQLLFEEKTDDDGILTLKNIVNGNYYLIVKDVENGQIVDSEKTFFEINDEKDNLDINLKINMIKAEVPNTGINKSVFVIGLIILLLGTSIVIVVYKKLKGEHNYNNLIFK